MAIWIKNAKKGSGECEVCDCQPTVCDLCFVCPTPTLKCDSVEISKSKTYCGYLNPDDGKHYLTKVVKLDYDFESDGTFSGACGSGTSSLEMHYHTTTTYTMNADTCEETVTYSGSSSKVSSYILDSNGVEILRDTCDSALSSTGEWSGTTHYITKSCTGDFENDGVGDTTTECGGSGGGTETTTYSSLEERSTEDLISEAMGDLPSFPGTWSGSCESAYDLSEDENTVSITHAKSKFTLAENMPAGQRMTITYRILWTPEEGEMIETEATTTIEPEASESGVIDLPVPTSNGVLAISTFEATCEATS